MKVTFDMMIMKDKINVNKQGQFMCAIVPITQGGGGGRQDHMHYVFCMYNYTIVLF